MKPKAVLLACALVLSSAPFAALADGGAERAQATTETRAVAAPASRATPMPVRRELTRDDLAAVLALLFLGRVPRGSEAAFAVQLTSR